MYVKQNYQIIQQSHFWLYIQKNSKQDLKEILAHPHSRGIIHNSQEATKVSNDG